MKIRAVETYIAGNPWKNWLFAKVITDEGLYGIGEGTLNYFGRTIEAAINPETQFIQGRARLAIRVRDNGTNTLTLRLAEPLVVSSIVSLEFGRLLHLRVRNQNTIIVNLPTTLVREADITLVLTYSGTVPAQSVDREALSLSNGQDEPPVITEPNYLLSNRSYWYPQNPIGDYATATLRLTVPRGYACVASGQESTTGADVTLRDLATMPSGRTFVFRADEPLRYLAFVVSRFSRVAQSTITVAAPDGLPRRDRQRNSVNLAVDSNPRQQWRGLEILGPVGDIMQFYASLMGDAPYASATVALVESELPGGHSPGYFAVVNSPVASSTCPAPKPWPSSPSTPWRLPRRTSFHCGGRTCGPSGPPPQTVRRGSWPATPAAPSSRRPNATASTSCASGRTRGCSGARSGSATWPGGSCARPRARS
jgi:hypothetical protein